ncbi:MAG: hypothetical protein M1421_01455 [Candidatus Eremiobacteraeota bacterium]|nr:hypothetical protein [Candidatus Eremiobacteraeota bacterium]MCL5055023.1 hypothetical protein [Bacillota bacterium]
MMLNPFKIYENLKVTFGDEQAKALASVIGEVYENLANIVTKSDFNELKEVVTELAEAQKRTEETVRILVLDVSELKSDMKDVKSDMKDIKKEMKDVKKQMGGLSMDVGYGIEDKYLFLMEDFALHQYGIKISRAERKFIPYPDGKTDEVNLYMEGEKKGKRVYLIGEAKAQPGKKDIDQFAARLERLRGYFKAEVKGFMIGYLFHPEVEEHAKANYPGIDLFKTYDIERTAKKAL